MHPALSIIFFTTVSGVGFSLIFWVGFYLLFIIDIDFPYPILNAYIDAVIANSISMDSGWDALYFILITPICLGIGIVLAAVGLTCSLFHLRRPTRAWRALSQWRSSWLSREGILAIFCLGMSALLFISLLIFVYQIIAWDIPHQLIQILAFFVIILSLLTVYSTAMIYAQLKAVQAWSTRLTPSMYITFGLAGGFLLWLSVAELQTNLEAYELTTIDLLVFLFIHCLSWLIMLVWWRRNDQLFTSGSTIETATRLDKLGEVKPFEPPHMGPNYLTSEMGYRINRKRIIHLRLISGGIGFILPIGLIALNLPIILAFLCQIVGIGLSRWLFFAEAKHTSMLYYYGNPEK